MNITEIQSAAQDLLEQIETLIKQRIPQKGDTADECQHITLINALNDLESAFSGLDRFDLEPDEDWETINKNAGFIKP